MYVNMIPAVWLVQPGVSAVEAMILAQKITGM